MAGSPQDYINKIWEESQKNAGLLRDQRTQTDDATIQQINEAIDRATNASVNPYKTQMEQLPAQYQKLFDTNAVQELVGRKQVQEAMALSLIHIYRNGGVPDLQDDYRGHQQGPGCGGVQ